MTNQNAVSYNNLFNYPTLHKILSNKDFLKTLSSQHLKEIISLRSTILRRYTKYTDTYSGVSGSCKFLAKFMDVLEKGNKDDFENYIQSAISNFNIIDFQTRKNYVNAINKDELEKNFKYVCENLVGNITYNPSEEKFFIPTSFGISKAIEKDDNDKKISHINIVGISLNSCNGEIRKTSYALNNIHTLDSYVQNEFMIGLGLK